MSINGSNNMCMQTRLAVAGGSRSLSAKQSITYISLEVQSTALHHKTEYKHAHSKSTVSQW